MTADDIAREGLLYVALALLFAGLLGGLWRPVRGVYQDSATLVHLRQTGPFVRGHARTDGGQQRFVGVAFFGRLLLRRYDYGRVHLSMLGFSPDQAWALEGSAMARLVLRRQGDDLVGLFYGRHFTFSGRRLVHSRWAAPSPRRWGKVPGDAAGR